MEFPYEPTKTTPGWDTGEADDLNVFYDTGHMAFMTFCAALVLLMIPGVGLFYSGLARRKSALELLLLSMLSVAVIGFQWFFWGYSLTFSRTGNSFLGNMDMIGLGNVIAQPRGAVLPDILFCLYQGMFASITPALAIGAVADRGRVLPALVFMFIWATVVYDPIAYWTWNPNGWLFKLGSLDFAGGGPVHVASGACALAYSLMLGKRSGYSKNAGMPWRPHNVTNVVLGTVFLWVGWFGFNGGSALGMNIRAVMACYNTQLAASMAALTWVLLDFRLERKWSTIGFCSGAISGLVAITPAAGFVTPWGALIIGIVGGVCCNFATKLKFLIGIDEALDIFAVHGVGGIVGNILTGVFAASWIAKLDGAPWEPLGWIEHHWVQMGYQFAGTVAAFAWSFVLTCLILFLLNLVPGLSLRASPEEEELGMDDVQLGEFAYDYVELTRHLSDTVSIATTELAAVNGSAGSEKGAPSVTGDNAV
ncbi:Ammonium transporter-like protein [Hapsidospora chrysogenum ATCC 11550]|uniref:Ammonium transporter n=1 Tax=Hapsidospora chrysogenum (strain ATCC 11550 / CBS 779.69 / DSM 880 / IAM 14645 / JCM 23072 / IMI 49137) TaxID=857340 RepID=A0A086SZD8_HAPC1|nr:Ammonium transporter-like protein [Hapsidospora chrysogenum ATCC 11550]